VFGFGRDLHFGIRLLAKSPVFTVTVAFLLAIGISANTLIFSVVDALLLRPLPVVHPENLVRLVEAHESDFVTWDLPYNFCDDVANLYYDLSDVICEGEADVSFSHGAGTERVRIHLVSPNFFSSLGVHAYIGRVLNGEDERTRAQNVVLSYDFWRRAFSGDPSIVGRKVVLGGHSFTVVGVSPQGFNGLAVDTSPDLRVPVSIVRFLVKPAPHAGPAVRPVWAQIFGRVRSGIAFERANADADPLLHSALEEESNDFFGVPQSARSSEALRSHVRLESIANGVSILRAQFSRSLKLLMAGIALLLMMACANAAALLLARSAARSQEMGVRLALGASRGRIVRQLFAEGLLLSVLGGLLGILLTTACLPLLSRVLPPIRDRGAVLQPISLHFAMDPRVLGFAMAATALTSILLALSPALRCTRLDIASTLKDARTATRRLVAGNLIVIAQVGICTILLLAAVLLIETLERMRSMNPGFDPDRVVTFTIDPQVHGYTLEQNRAFSKTLLERANSLPGVICASIATRGAMRGTGMKATFAVAGTRITPNDFLDASANEVTPGYFETMGIHLLAGRVFTWFDRGITPPYTVIVNQAFARRFFSEKNPIGERFGFPGPGGIATATNQIIGVVSDAKYRSLREPIPPTVYSPMVDGFEDSFVLHVRTNQNPELVIAPVRELVRSMDSEMPIIETGTLRQEVDASLWQEHLLALLSTIFAGVAALLASIGLYGAIDYSVKSRTREIGVRAALGADPARIIGLLSQQALLLTTAGIAVGLSGYAVASVYLQKLVYDVRPWDPVVLSSVSVAITLMTAVAAAPALARAVHIDPASALRRD
jgi:predicted permease